MDNSQFLGHRKALKFAVRNAVARRLADGSLPSNDKAIASAKAIMDERRRIERNSMAYKVNDLRARNEPVAVRQGKLINTSAAYPCIKALDDNDISTAFKGVDRSDPSIKTKFICDVEV